MHSIRLHGSSAAGDIYLDGMREIAQYNRDTFNLERDEVLRASFIPLRSSPFIGHPNVTSSLPC